MIIDKIRSSAVCLLVSAAILQACSPAPRHTLSSEEKTADLYWVYSQFTENYAPLEYKQTLHKIDYEQLKKKYLADAEQMKSNEEFYNLYYSFVAEFRDAHTSGSMTDSGLPGRTFVAYLGFSGKRQGNNLVVTDLLPTIVQAETAFPIKTGDIISAVDGVALPDVVKNEFVKTRNLGQDESNLTFHMNRIFNRSSILGGLPSKDSVTVTFKRGDAKEQTITMPWVIKDTNTFAAEQAEAVAAAKKKAGDSSAPAPARSVTDDKDAMYSIGLQLMNGNFDVLVNLLKKTVRSSPDFRFWDTFVFVDTLPTPDSQSIRDLLAQADAILNGKKAGDSPSEVLEKVRSVPANAMFIKEAKTYPTYVTLEKEMKDGKPTGRTKRVAYMYLNTFSPTTGEEKDVQAEVLATLKVLDANGIQDLVIDMINNGGGSLSLGMKLAQALSSEKIAMPDMQFRLSESWIDQFEQASQKGGSPSDVEREVARRTMVALKEDQAKGLRLSRRMNAEALAPFEIRPNTALTQKLRIVLMVNEMCASMCDIFTAIMKDNLMATVVGSQTMGAGGNVVTHFQSPNAHFILNQTESLMVRADGTYLENHGVQPDVAIAVNESVLEKYEPVRKKAIEVLFKD